MLLAGIIIDGIAGYEILDVSVVNESEASAYDVIEFLTLML